VRYLIIETCNFGKDYPDEKFLSLPATSKESAQKIADTINNVHCAHGNSLRYWRVVKEGYKLEPGFRP
jgi:hypothetical protein